MELIIVGAALVLLTAGIILFRKSPHIIPGYCITVLLIGAYIYFLPVFFARFTNEEQTRTFLIASILGLIALSVFIFLCSYFIFRKVFSKKFNKKANINLKNLSKNNSFAEQKGTIREAGQTKNKKNQNPENVPQKQQKSLQNLKNEVLERKPRAVQPKKPEATPTNRQNIQPVKKKKQAIKPKPATPIIQMENTIVIREEIAGEVIFEETVPEIIIEEIIAEEAIEEETVPEIITEEAIAEEKTEETIPQIIEEPKLEQVISEDILSDIMSGIEQEETIKTDEQEVIIVAAAQPEELNSAYKSTFIRKHGMKNNDGLTRKELKAEKRKQKKTAKQMALNYEISQNLAPANDAYIVDENLKVDLKARLKQAKVYDQIDIIDDETLNSMAENLVIANPEEEEKDKNLIGTDLRTAFAHKAKGDYEQAQLAFESCIINAKDNLEKKQIELELLDTLIRLEKNSEAAAKVFNILRAGYDLNEIERTRLMRIMRILENQA